LVSSLLATPRRRNSPASPSVRSSKRRPPARLLSALSVLRLLRTRRRFPCTSLVPDLLPERWCVLATSIQLSPPELPLQSTSLFRNSQRPNLPTLSSPIPIRLPLSQPSKSAASSAKLCRSSLPLRSSRSMKSPSPSQVTTALPFSTTPRKLRAELQCQ